jgi:hypothetical protein
LDLHDTAVFLLAVVAPGGLAVVLGALGLRITWLAAVWIAAWTFWIAYGIALAMT